MYVLLNNCCWMFNRLSSKHNSNLATSNLLCLPRLNSFQAAYRFAILVNLCHRLPSKPPHRAGADISIIHKIKVVYAYIYQTGHKLNKRDKLGIHQQVEQLTLTILTDIIRTALTKRNDKLTILEHVRVSLEVLKHLVRTEYELKIIPAKTYWYTQKMLVEISKMANGWIKYLS